MLSDKLRYLRDYIAKGNECGMTFEPLAVQCFAAVLDECANDATALEQAVVPAHLRLSGELPDNVVVVEAFRERRDAQRTYTFPEGFDPSGGAA